MSVSRPDSIVDTLWLARPATEVAPDLVGCTLVRSLADGCCLRSQIVETEAYTPTDPACHGYRGQTRRNAAMFGRAGLSYVYLIYGLYHCFNVVTDCPGLASAVLIRAVQLSHLPPWASPKDHQAPHRAAAGPGKLCRLLKIDQQFNGAVLAPETGLWLEHRPTTLSQPLVQTTRIGLSQATDLPWRWYLANSPAVSKP
ncbi:DNA-3-methyladenine glycosylase [Almyronema epifaneia]|uniref:Putative 3-methyladenine DNA glycosylase n=1 Tax=Almyronema epifaneia S1 TaxID=2991925 RepID=A0ABW6IAL4_9CYAN